ncbi:MAG TPA: hypothetical protein VIW68_15105 [Candidatus Sulfotelmatobacter sp.]
MSRTGVVKISQEQLERAAIEAGLLPENAQAIWRQLHSRSDVEAHFEAAHVGYYFGALLVIGAMGWFMTNGWDSFRGWEVFAIASGYAAIFVLVGRLLWPRPQFRIPSGLFITMAVCMVPLAVYGLERQFKLWPSIDPGSYATFHPYINASWVAMEGATVLASAIALRYFPFPFLTAPAAYALWYMSMDLTALLFGKQWQWRQLCEISAAFGLVMLLVSYWADHRTKLDYSFWGYLFGLMTFTGGLSLLDSGSQLAKLAYCLIHVAMVVVSLVLQRKVFLVFGALGVFGYLADEAYSYFRTSVAFPFVLSFIGIALIVAAMKFKKNEAAWQQRLARRLPPRTA